MERLYTIPLRKEFRKAPNYERTSRSITAIRDFVKKHMKNENVKIGKYLNLEIWKHGRKNPPARIKVKVFTEKEKDVEYVIVELPHVKIEKPKKEVKKKEKLKEETIDVNVDEHKTEEEKEKHEVLQHEIHKETQPDMKIKPQKQKIKEKPMIIGRTSKK